MWVRPKNRVYSVYRVPGFGVSDSLTNPCYELVSVLVLSTCLCSWISHILMRCHKLHKKQPAVLVAERVDLLCLGVQLGVFHR